MASGSSLMDNKQVKEDRLQQVLSENEMVSRRTYNLIIGATLIWGILIDVAMAMFLSEPILQLHPLVVLIGYLVVSLGSMYVIYKSDVPAISFAGFTVLAAAMGVLLTFYVQRYTGAEITTAFCATGAVLFIMMAMATAFPNFFLGLGKTLIMALLAAIVVELVLTLITGTHSNAFNWIIVIIFSLYCGYDWSRAQAYPPSIDNAIDSAADIYVDIVNIFIRILSILGNSRS